ncbi:MAG: hypothetical protein NVS1B11_04430 [Terriglobales bacterium]
MTNHERDSWDARYQRGSHASLVSDPFLIQAYEEFIHPVFPNEGAALDLAGGVGRHAIWLAQRDWRVTLLDISKAGVGKAIENAGALATKISFEIGDAANFHGRGQYDLVLVFFFLQREIFPELVNALSPGGLLVYKTYTHLHLQFGSGPTHPMHLLQENELLKAFSGLKILHYNETIRERGVAELVARKP